MFGLFRKSATGKPALEKQYQKLMDESYKLSHSNRKQSDDKRSEAEAILKQIEAMEE